MSDHTKIIDFARKHKDELLNRYSLAYYLASNTSRFTKYQRSALILLASTEPRLISNLLKTEPAILRNIINNPQYNHYQIAKSKGGLREIYAPSAPLKRAQKIFNYYLQGYYYCIKPNEVHGFVINPYFDQKRCNIVSNAESHVNKKHLLNIDIKDFFPSIPAKRVFELFTCEYFAFPDKIAAILSLLCTYEGFLPAGSPASPVISNFICLGLDERIKAFCSDKDLNYSRYADDLSFSSNQRISEEQIASLKQIISESGFTVNERKVYLRSSASRQTVTGITVNQKPNVSRKILKNTRAMLHDMQTNGIESATQKHFNLSTQPTEQQLQIFIHRLEGYINFIGMVRGKNDRIYSKMKIGFDEVFGE